MIYVLFKMPYQKQFIVNIGMKFPNIHLPRTNLPFRSSSRSAFNRL